MVKNIMVKPKHQQVYDRLINILTEGTFEVGDRLPSERDFAAKLNVNVLRPIVRSLISFRYFVYVK